MIRDTLQSISGIEFFPIIALIMFFAIFALVIIWVAKLDKNVLREMENLPFDTNKIDGDK